MSKENLERIRDAVVNGDEPTAKSVSEDLLKLGVNPLEVIEEYLAPAMKLVGERFEKGEYFLTNLMLAAEAMKAATSVLMTGLGSEAQGRIKGQRRGSVVLGTVTGDVHDIGKNILSLLLEANGFEIHDLGKDVPSMRFVEESDKVKADIIALSSLMTTTRIAQKDVIDLLEGIGVRKRYIVMVGGAPTTQEWADEIGADGWKETAVEAVKLAQQLMASRTAPMN